jgi:hypothetical protein
MQQDLHAVNVARVARALYDFEPGNADEIRFKKGDMVEVIGEEDCNWWKGRCHGQEGIFPAAYVKISIVSCNLT